MSKYTKDEIREIMKKYQDLEVYDANQIQEIMFAYNQGLPQDVIDKMVRLKPANTCWEMRDLRLEFLEGEKTKNN